MPVVESRRGDEPWISAFPPGPRRSPAPPAPCSTRRSCRSSRPFSRAASRRSRPSSTTCAGGSASAAWRRPTCRGNGAAPDCRSLEFAHVGEALGRSPLGHYVFNCQAPDAGNMELLLHHGTAEQRERWLAAARPRRGPQLLRHDRAGARRLEPRLARHHRPARRRRLRDRRPQVVHLLGRRRRLRDRDGGDRPAKPAPHPRASQILVPTDTPGFQLVAEPAGHGRARRAAGRATPRCGSTGVRVPAGQPPRRGGRRLRARPGAAGAGPHPPLHALDRHLRARLRPDVRARRHARARPRPARSAAASSCRPGSPRAAPRSTPPACSCCAPPGASTARARPRRATTSRLIKFHVAGTCCRECSTAPSRPTAPSASPTRRRSPTGGATSAAARIYDGADEVHKTAVAGRILRRYGMAPTPREER